MKKWILLIILSGLCNTTLAAHYSVAVCEELENTHKEHSALLNAHMSEKQQQRSIERRKALFTKITHNCDLALQPRSYRIANHNLLASQPQTDMSVYIKRYSSEHKQAAWVEYYELPQQCRRLAMSNSDFVWCSENRAKQRAGFESRWQEQQRQAEITPADEIYEIILPSESSSISSSTNIIIKHNSNLVPITIIGLTSFLLLFLAYGRLLKSKVQKHTK